MTVGTRPRRILLVCHGNTCRSPIAQGILEALAAEHGLSDTLVVDSAGVACRRPGGAPDPRAISVSLKHGLDISGQRSRPVVAEDFHAFDLILAMDQSVAAQLKSLEPVTGTARVAHFLNYCINEVRDVADPYVGDQSAYNIAYRDIRAGMEALTIGWLTARMSRDRL